MVVAVLVAVLSVPLLIALVAIGPPRWYPLMDMAQVELRVRDVGSSNPPLIGLKGRFFVGEAKQASHPGPLAFWLLWPPYRAVGSTAWAMQVATVLLQMTAAATALWIARRRGGLGLVLGVAAMLAILMRAYGALTLTEAWIPHLPLLWWVVFVLAVWSITCRDLALLPVAVFAGSLCVQAHISYLGTVLGLGAVAVVAAGVTIAQRRSSNHEGSSVRWVFVGACLGVLLWAPPVIEEATRSPGNLSALWSYFSTSGGPPIGLRSGFELLLIHLDPWRLVSGQVLSNRALVTGSTLPGTLLLAGWAVTAVVAVRLKHPALVRFHAVVGSTAVLAALSMSRIIGELWYYLVLWGWALGALLGLCVVWTLAVLVARLGVLERSSVPQWASGRVVLSGALVASTVVFAGQATRVEILAPELSVTLAELVPSTVAALSAGSIPGTGDDGRYLITWTDQMHLGAQGWALLNELDREGLSVGTLRRYQAQATRAHVRSPADATAVVNLATGSNIEEWRNKPGVYEIAYFDPATEAERIEYARLRATLIRQLEAADLSDLVRLVDTNLFFVAYNPKVPESAGATIGEMRRIDVPAAVFVGPPEAIPGS